MEKDVPHIIAREKANSWDRTQDPEGQKETASGGGKPSITTFLPFGWVMSVIVLILCQEIDCTMGPEWG